MISENQFRMWPWTKSETTKMLEVELEKSDNILFFMTIEWGYGNDTQYINQLIGSKTCKYALRTQDFDTSELGLRDTIKRYVGMNASTFKYKIKMVPKLYANPVERAMMDKRVANTLCSALEKDMEDDEIMKNKISEFKRTVSNMGRIFECPPDKVVTTMRNDADLVERLTFLYNKICVSK